MVYLDRERDEEKNVGTGSRQQAAMFEQRMWVDSKRCYATSLTHP